jgi:hypothetical protein
MAPTAPKKGDGKKGLKPKPLKPAKKPAAGGLKPKPLKPAKKPAKKPAAGPRLYTRSWSSCRDCDFDLCAACAGAVPQKLAHAHPLKANKTGALPLELELARKCDACGANNLGGVTCSDGSMRAKPKPRRAGKPPVRPRHAQVKKPVLYLYPVAPCEVAVSLALTGRGARLSALLPAPAQAAQRAATWRVAASPDGTLQPLGGGPPVASLFWEAQGVAGSSAAGGACALLPRGARDTFCVAGAGAGAWLLAALRLQGLSPREYTECASFWAPLMAEHPFVVLRFVPQQVWEGLAPLAVAGLPAAAPTRTLRVFIAWRGVAAFSPGHHQGTLPLQVPARPVGENLVVEWGGQECH